MKTFARLFIFFLLAISGVVGGGLIWQRAQTSSENQEKLSDIKNTAALLRTRWAARSFSGQQAIDLTDEAAELFQKRWMQDGKVKVTYYPRETALFSMRVFSLTLDKVPTAACQQWLPDLMRNSQQQKILSIKLGGIDSNNLPSSISPQDSVKICQNDPTLVIVFLF